MIDRISGASLRTHSYDGSDTGAIAAAAQNPLLATMAVAQKRLHQLRSMTQTWVDSGHARINAAREASDFATLAGDMAQRVSAGARQEALPQALRDFAVQHELVSPQAAAEPFDAAGLQQLESKLRSLALASDVSSTKEQIQLKSLVSRYDNTLTLYNAVIARLGEVTKKIVNSM